MFYCLFPILTNDHFWVVLDLVVSGVLCRITAIVENMIHGAGLDTLWVR